jgi:hypothetical protein
MQESEHTMTDYFGMLTVTLLGAALTALGVTVYLFERDRLRAVDPAIRAPRVVYAGFDWTRTDRLKPTGDASRDRALAAKFSA